MTLAVVAKGILIALMAAIAAWLPYAILNASDGGLTFSLLPFALLGSFAVGLPIALLIFFLAGNELRTSPGIVFLMANLAGVMLMLASFVLGDTVGIVALGVPSLIAANTYALLGWFWILKPMREAELMRSGHV